MLLSVIKENRKEFEICGIDKFWAKGYTGKGIKVANMEKANPDLWFYHGKVSCPTNHIYEKFSNYHGNQTMDVIHQIAPDSDLITLSNATSSINSHIEGVIIDVSIPYMINNGVHLVNASLGGNDIKTLNDIILDAQSYGVVFCTSAGNIAEKGLKGYGKSNKWISVGAVHYYDNDKKIKLATYSSKGKELDISCFSNLYIHDARKDYKGRVFPVQGTSFSSPMFTGMLALVQQFFLEKIGRTLYQNEIELFIQDHVIDLGEIGWDELYGYGLFVLPEPSDINIEKYLLRGKPHTTTPTEPVQPTVPIPPIENNPPIQSPIKDIISTSDYNTYLNFKAIYDGAKKDNNKVAMDYAKQTIIELLDKYGIVDDSFNDEILPTNPVEPKPEIPKEPEKPIEETPIENKILIALDDGHGMETIGKRTPILPNDIVMKENEFNSAVVNKLDVILKRCGFNTLLTAPTDVDTPLKDRTDLANSKKVNILVSVHANAYDGKFDNYDPEGVETFHYPNSTEGKKLAETVHKHLIQGTKQINRGVKTADFFVLRESSMPAILIEAAFMDNLKEANLLLSDSFREEVAKEIALGICEYYNVPYVEDAKPIEIPKEEEIPDTDTLYRVQVGAYKNKANAEKLLDDLKKAGFNGFISATKVETPIIPPKVEAPKESTPINVKSKYYKIGDAHIIETSPENIEIKILGNTLQNANKYGINGTFFQTSSPNNPDSCWAIATNNGQPIGGNSMVVNYDKAIKRGTLIYFKDGTIGNKRINNTNEIWKPHIWSISGFTVLPYMDFKGEKMESGINYKTAHTYIGNRGNKIYLIVKPNHMIEDIVPLLSQLGIENCLVLDGGQSSQFNHPQGQYTGSRKINSAVILKEV